MGTQRLLVLGASGFLGPHLVRAAIGRGLTVVAASRHPRAALGLVAPDAARLETWDAADRGGLAALVERVGPTHVVLAAALSRVAACERDPAAAEALNAALPAEAARLARRHGFALTHLSTDLVFGARPPRGARFDEDDPPAPLHAYGRTKVLGEEHVRAELPAALTLRLPLLYGDSRGRGLGATDQILAALERGERPPLFTDEWRTPLDAADAAAAVIELTLSGARGLLHLAGPERLSRLELGLALLCARGRSASAARAALRPALRAELGLNGERPADVSLDGTRARALLATPLLAPEAALARGVP